MSNRIVAASTASRVHNGGLMADPSAASSPPTPGAAPAPFQSDALTAETLRDLLDGAPDAIVVIDGSGLIHFASSECERTFGYTPAALSGQNVEILVPEVVREAHAAHRSRYRDEPRNRPMGAGLELMGRRCDGSEFPIEISLSPVAGARGPLVMAAVRDITERRAARQASAALHEWPSHAPTPLLLGLCEVLQAQVASLRPRQ